MNDLVKKQADRYVARLFSGEMTEKEAALIGAWKGVSDDNAAAFEASLKAWADVELLRDDAAIRALAEEPAKFDVGRLAKWLPVAAAVVVAAFVTSLWWPQPGTGVQVMHVSTVVGERKTVELLDGSTIMLNTDSAVFVSYEDNKRQVLLNHGEAFFDVIADSDRPFTVESGRHSMTVLGTEFNVHRLSAEETMIAVVEGRVGLHRDDEFDASLAQTIAIPKAGKRPLRVSMSDNAVIEAGGIATLGGDVSTAVVQRLTARSVQAAWRTGRVVFRGQRLSQIVRELNRYSQHPIVIRDSHARNLEISAVLDLDDFNAIIDRLEYIAPVTVTRTGKHIVISTRWDSIGTRPVDRLRDHRRYRR